MSFLSHDQASCVPDRPTERHQDHRRSGDGGRDSVLESRLVVSVVGACVGGEGFENDELSSRVVSSSRVVMGDGRARERGANGERERGSETTIRRFTRRE